MEQIIRPFLQIKTVVVAAPTKTVPQIERKKIVPKVSQEKMNISIDYRKNVSNTSLQTNHTVAQKRSRVFTYEELDDAWAKYMCQLEHEHVRKMMEDVDRQVVENDAVFDVFVESSLQKDILLEEKEKVVPFLRDALQNDSVDFNIIIRAKDPSVKKVVTNADRFGEMLDTNEDFRKFAQAINLEIN